MRVSKLRRKRSILILFITLCWFNHFSQLGSLLFAGSSIAKEISKTKKSKLAVKYAKNVFIESDSVLVLRVPEDKIKSQAKYTILDVQKALDGAYNKYLLGLYVDVDVMQRLIYTIPPNDQDWNIELYKNEAQAYSNYDMARRERERKAEQQKYSREMKQRDSLRIVREKRQDFVYDSLNTTRGLERRREDSLMIVFRCKGYHFINADEIDLKEKPSDKSRTLASIGGTSYVKVVSKAASGYVQIEISDLRGYVKETALVNSLFKINYVGADLQYAKKNYTVSTTETAEQTLYNDRIFRRKTPQYSTGREYYTGPRGGCYYYSSSGKKVYVDHSYCR